MSRNNFHGTFGDYDDYNTFNLEKQKWSELRKEYRRLRKEAKQRINELKNSEFADSKLLQNKEYLTEDVSNMTKDELVRYTAYTASFLASDLSTVKGQEERVEYALEKMHDLGYHDINREDIKPLFRYMDDLSTFMKGLIKGSDPLITTYETAKENKVDIKDVVKALRSYFAERLKEIENMPKEEFKQSSHEYTAEELWNIVKKQLDL